MLKGQCLCGAVKYQYHAELEQTILCFCSHCRLAQGGIVAWNSAIQAVHFELLSGQDVLQSYEHSALKYRVFCNVCGSPIYSYRDDLKGVLRLRLGTVTEGKIPEPALEYFSEQKPVFIHSSNCEHADL